MKFQQVSKILAGVLLIAMVAGCRQKAGTFQLTGKLQGIIAGKMILSGTMDESEKADTVPIKNGEFVFNTSIKEGAQYKLSIDGREGYPYYFYAENAQMMYTAHADSLYKGKLTGGTISEDQERYQEGMKGIREKINKEYHYDTLVRQYMKTKSEVLKAKMDAIIPKIRAEYDQYQLDFIKKNPTSFYSALLISYKAEGQSAKELEESLQLLDPKLDEFAVVQDIRQMVEDKKTTDVNVGEFTCNAPDVDYAVDNAYTGKELRDMVYLAALPNDNICALRKDGFVCIINPKGGKLSEFTTTLKSTPSALAIDQSTGEIYVLGTLINTKEVKQRGKTYKVDEPQGVECIVYDTKGKVLKNIALSELKTATGAKVLNKKLLVADYGAKKVCIYSLETGKMESNIKDLRTCCRILDFGLNAKNEILVANLGAFRVQAFDYSGKIKYAFGKRGQSVNDFHGCCNPVNVSSLTNGAIVTVEKDPTRIKVYSKSGARQISGIQDLVKGCKYIPMTCDSKNNIYLASAQSGIVKCSPAKTKD